jgi:pimeloyl-ACP methyl ester carboxylesterase
MSLGRRIHALAGVAVLVVAASNDLGGQPPPPLGSLVDVGGYRIHLYCIGRGGPAVVITGAGGSFDWGLVQPKLAKATRVCSYDRSGTAWSDPGPADSCRVRVRELHDALKTAGETGPFVLVGHSLGALVSRLYAATYPGDVAGMVIVDHATDFPARNVSLPDAPAVVRPASPAPSPVRVPPGEDAFRKLPPLDYAMHEWAASLPGATEVRRTTPAILPACSSDVDSRTAGRRNPLGDRPLAVMHTDSGDRGAASVSRYAELQQSLADLSTNSIKVQADFSSHYMMLDRPELVVSTTRRVVEAVRTRTRLGR